MMNLEALHSWRFRSKYKFKRCTRAFTVVLLMMFVYFSYYGPRLPWSDWRDADFHQVVKENKADGSLELKQAEIVILRWTAYWGEYSEAKIFDTRKCSFLQAGGAQKEIFNLACRITYDRRYLPVSQALLFHSYDLLWEWLPRKRDHRQLWIYLQQESPIYTKLDLSKFSDTFNWTMTYRRDSDVCLHFQRPQRRLCVPKHVHDCQRKFLHPHYVLEGL